MIIKGQKRIDKGKVVEHLNRIFSSATRGLPKASRYVTTKTWKRNKKGFGVPEDLPHPRVEKTELYDLQSDFCYFIREIQNSPEYVVSKVIADCNQFIDDIVTNRL